MAKNTGPVICPRCGQSVAELVAYSRVSGVRDDDDAPADICNPCGSDEASEAFFDGRTRPVSRWPAPRTFHDRDGETVRTATGEVVAHYRIERVRLDDIR